MVSSKLTLTFDSDNGKYGVVKTRKDALNADPRCASAFEGQGRMAEARGDRAEAEALYRTAAMLDPSGEGALRCAALLERRGEPAIAAEILDGSDLPEAGARWVWLRAACPDARVRRPKEALETARALAKSVRGGRAEAMVWHAHFAALAANGLRAEALAAAQDMLDRLSTHPQAQQSPLAEFLPKLAAQRATVAAGQPLRAGFAEFAPLLPFVPKSATERP